MDSSLSDKITAKVFVGCLLTPEVRMHLNSSDSWKQVHTIDHSEERLQELRFQDKDYLGHLVDTAAFDHAQLKTTASAVRDAIITHCPELPEGSIRVKIFPQVFLS